MRLDEFIDSCDDGIHVDSDLEYALAKIQAIKSRLPQWHTGEPEPHCVVLFECRLGPDCSLSNDTVRAIGLCQDYRSRGGYRWVPLSDVLGTIRDTETDGA